MRYTSRHERARSSTTDCDLIANHEGDFTAQDVGDLIAVVMDVQVGNGVGRRNFLDIITLWAMSLVILSVADLPGAICHTAPCPGCVTKLLVFIAVPHWLVGGRL